MKKKGFTLVELMIVISILGILTSIGIFAFQSSQQKSRDSRRKSDLSNVAAALEMYNSDVGSYPATGTDTQGTIKGCGDTTKTECAWGTSFANTTKATYMVKLPKDPSSPTSEYMYEKSGTGYRLYARLDNLQDSFIESLAEPKVFNVKCGSFCCNFVLVSTNVVEPTPQACL